MTELEFFYDCSSPWTYLAFSSLQDIVSEYGLNVTYRPILAGAVFNAVNPSVYEVRKNIPSKGAWGRKDLADWRAIVGLSFDFPPPIHPVNSVKAMRGCVVAAERGREIAFAFGVFAAYHEQWRDISQDEVLAEISLQAGLRDDFIEAIGSDRAKAELRRNTDELIARGGFGSPTFFLDGELFFGLDRLRHLTLRLEQSKGARCLPPTMPFWRW